MDGRRFDAMVRMWSIARTRRGVAWMIAAGVLSTAGAGQAEAGPVCLVNGTECGPGVGQNCVDCCHGCSVKTPKRGQRHFACGRRRAKLCRHDHNCCPGYFCAHQRCKILPPSDRALKTALAMVDAAQVLAGVAQLPIATWSYTFDDPAVRHIGPMAQDFAAAFGVGDDDRAIHSIDGQGVAFAAIQALHGMATALRAENAALRARLDALERRDSDV